MQRFSTLEYVRPSIELTQSMRSVRLMLAALTLVLTTLTWKREETERERERDRQRGIENFKKGERLRKFFKKVRSAQKRKTV